MRSRIELSTISSTVISDRFAASTASFCTPRMPHICTLPVRSARCAWMIVTSGASAGTAVSTSPVNGHVIGADRVRVRRQIGADVAAQDRERESARAGRVAVGHAGVAVLLELERQRPGVLDRVAEAMQPPTPGLPPHEKMSSARTPMPINWS